MILNFFEDICLFKPARRTDPSYCIAMDPTTQLGFGRIGIRNNVNARGEEERKKNEI